MPSKKSWASPRRARAGCLACAVALSAFSPFSSPAVGADCTATSTGLVPLSDLGAGMYLGFSGGLYPNGQNAPPPAHGAALMAAADGVAPLDPDGNVDPHGGKIGFTTMGMSNTSRHSQAFAQLLASTATGVDPHVVFFNGAQGGKPASSWANPSDPVWDNLEARVAGAGLTNLQVQVVWVLQAEPASNLDAFPAGANQIKNWLIAALQILKGRFPNMRIAYFSSRIYAGYASTNLNPEPFAYETGFAVKWLIVQQISGDPELAYDGPSLKVPVLAWGPYLWADGLGSDGVAGGVPGRSDGLEWTCGDMADDGTHPSSQGAAKVAGILFDWLVSDASAQLWFLSGGGPATGADVPPIPVISVVPNPSRELVWVDLPFSGRGEVSVFDVAGRLVFSRDVGPLPARVPFLFSDLPSGVYFVRVATGGRLAGTVRITRIR